MCLTHTHSWTLLLLRALDTDGFIRSLFICLFIPTQCVFLWLVKRQILSEIWWASEYTDECALIDTNILNTALSQKTSSQGWHSTFYWKRNKVTLCYKMNNLYQHKTPSLVTVLLVPWIRKCSGAKDFGKAQIIAVVGGQPTDWGLVSWVGTARTIQVSHFGFESDLFDKREDLC